MKKNPEMTVKELFEEMTGTEMGPVTRADGTPLSAMEEAEARAGLQVAIADFATKMRTMCAGCGSDVPMLETEACMCGGFVCQSCQKLEEDGVCDHERPAFLPLVDDDDNF